MTRQEITAFYEEHHRRLYNIAWRILRNPLDAEEVMQDTILKFVTASRPFSSPAQESAWLARTCIHAAIDRLRRLHRRDAFLQDYGRQEQEMTGRKETTLRSLYSRGRAKLAELLKQAI